MAHPAYLREKERSLRVGRALTIDELAAQLGAVAEHELVLGE
jgi:hypothetical protein